MHPSTPRWPIAVIAVMIQLCLGAGYSWTVFRFPLESAYGWTYSSTAEPFRYLLLAYTFGMTFGGYLQDRFGPRKIATLGGLLVSAGCALGALYGSTPLGMSAGYATLCGLGMGFAYVPALAVLVKWFPDRRGMIVGLAVFRIRRRIDDLGARPDLVAWARSSSIRRHAAQNFLGHVDCISDPCRWPLPVSQRSRGELN